MTYVGSFIPWIAVTALTGTMAYPVVVLIGLALAVLLTAVALARGADLAMLVIEIGTAVYFAGLGVAALATSADGVETYGAPLSSLWLAATAWGSLAAGRPFTLGIARRSVPREHWDAPLFLRVNRVITAVWAAAFTVHGLGALALRHWLGDDGTAQTALAIASIAVPALFTVRYPAHARGRHQAHVSARCATPGTP